MNDFQTYVTTYGQMLNCPDPLTLLDYQAQALDEGACADIDAHLAACPACREALVAFQELPAESFEVHLPERLPTLADEPDRGETRPLTLQAGQIWLLKGRIDLADHALPASQQGERVIDSGALRLVVLTDTGKKHLGKAAFQELSVCPISEEILMATDRDLVLESPSLSALGPCMIETWNPQIILALQLQDWLGDLSAQELIQLQALIGAASAAPFVVPAGVPHGGEVVRSEGAHARFQALEQDQASRLNLPYQALQTALKEIRPYLAEIGKGRLKAAASPEKAPQWLHLPRRYQREQQIAPVLAASSSQEAAAEPEASGAKEVFRLLDDVLLEMWVEGENLEFYCRHERGEDLAGLAIRYADVSALEQELLTDELGTAFIPLREFSPGEPTLLEFSWQNQVWTYPFAVTAPAE